MKRGNLLLFRVFFVLFIIFWRNNFAFAQRVQLESGFKFNNDFTTYYRDFKPFYYSALTADLLFTIKKTEWVVGIRYMPYLNAVRPELGVNYYFKYQPEKLANYFIHTSVFYNEFSYNNRVNYENYNYNFLGAKPNDYNAVRMRYGITDLAFGVKLGFNNRWVSTISAGGGYFLSKRDAVEGQIFSMRIKEKYSGFQYNFRVGVRYVILPSKVKEIEVL